MNVLFETMQLQSMILPNRFVRSATIDSCADQNGHVTPQQIDLLATLAEGGVGLIITGAAYIHANGQSLALQNSIADDACIPGLQQLTTAVHERGAHIAVQLFHAGRDAVGISGLTQQEVIAPSIIPEETNYPANAYHVATEEEIRLCIQAFGKAAVRARQAGFDAVQIHAAHGFLLSQFLSPFTNRRDDAWGGTFEHRLRLCYEILREIRTQVGEAYPVLIKLGVADGCPGGLDFEEGQRAARRLAQWGIDAIEVSLGVSGSSYATSPMRPNIKTQDQEAYYRNWCQALKNQVKVPVIMVGGLRTPALMEDVIHQQDADFISLCRPLVREPGLVKHWKTGDRRRAACVSCNECVKRVVQDEPLHCVLNS